MRLTRRDALAALAGATAAGVAGCTADSTSDPAGEPALSPAATETLVAAAEVLYPDEVEGIREFVRTYVEGRTREDRRRRVVETTTTDLREAARSWYGDEFAALSPADREATLREVGAATADPEPASDGSLAGRVRCYVVNELLYALYTSPAGGRLVGTENPVGYPGGITSYRQGPS